MNRVVDFHDAVFLAKAKLRQAMENAFNIGTRVRYHVGASRLLSGRVLRVREDAVMVKADVSGKEYWVPFLSLSHDDKSRAATRSEKG